MCGWPPVCKDFGRDGQLRCDRRRNADRAFLSRRRWGEPRGCAVLCRHIGGRIAVTSADGTLGAPLLDRRGRGNTSRRKHSPTAALLPLFEDGTTVSHVLGAASYRPLAADEAWKGLRRDGFSFGHIEANA